MAEHLEEQLARWVTAGLLQPEQAARILKTEMGRRAAPSRTSLIVETLGYLGGLLAVIAGFIAVGELWPDIPTSAEIAFAAVGAAVLLAAGAALPSQRDPALGRLRSVLWLLSTACVAATVALLTADVWDFGGPSVALTTAAVSTAYALPLWLRTRAPLQHIALFAGTVAVVASGVLRIDEDLHGWWVGLAVWATSALWLAVVHTDRLPPRSIGYVVGAIGLLIGAQLSMTAAAGHALALLTVAALLTAGVVMRKVALLAIGAYGILQVVPQTAVRYLPESVGAPLALFVVAVILLMVALRLTRWSGRDGGMRRPPTWRHRSP